MCRTSTYPLSHACCTQQTHTSSPPRALPNCAPSARLQALVDLPTKFDASGKTGLTVKEGDFGFTYLVSDGNSIGDVTYSKKDETWWFKAKS